MKAWVYQVAVRGKIRWRVDYKDLGQRKRQLFRNHAAAQHFAAQQGQHLKSAQATWAGMTEQERERVILEHHERMKNPVVSGKKAPGLGTVIEELIVAKRAAGRSEGYLTDLRQKLAQFSRGMSALPMDAVSLAMVEQWLDGKGLASRATWRSRLSGLFTFAMRRGYRPDNPCQRLEAVTYLKPPPQVFAPAEFTKAMDWLRTNAPHGRAWFVLSTCCGLRPQEAEKTTKRDIHFKEGFVKVEGQTSKIRQRRVVYPRAEAMALLKRVLKRSRLPLHPQARRRIIRGLRADLGWKAWPKDVTRHTAASYWLAGGASAGHVAEMLGNSESVLKRDYKALKTRKEAAEFWRATRKA